MSEVGNCMIVAKVSSSISRCAISGIRTARYHLIFISHVMFVLCCALLNPIVAWSAVVPATEVARALDAIASGHLEEAEAALAKAQFNAPDDPKILYNLGLVQLHKRSYELGARYFTRVVNRSNDPELRAAALHNQGNCWYHAARFQESVTAYEQSLQEQENAETRFNLEQAKKKLAEMLQQMADQQQQQQQQQQKQSAEQTQPSGNDQQQQQQQQGEKGAQSPDDQNQRAENTPSADQQRQQQQTGQDGQPKDQDQNQNQNQNQQQYAQANEPGENGENQTENDQQRQQQQQQRQQQPTDGQEQAQSQAGEEDANASTTAQIGEQNDETDSREDVQMTASPPDAKEPPPSQRARAMQNRKMNPYMVEKILRELEERERELQLRYRNEDNHRREDDDPFFMNAQQMRDWFEGRRRPKPKSPPADEPDW